MKFLIDECLHTSLIALAHQAGRLCEHVNFLGLGGYKDWQLMATIRGDDYTFVTNNRTDFTPLYAQEELHAGLVIIIPNVTPSRQRDLFQAATVPHRLAGSDECCLGSRLGKLDRYLSRIPLSKFMKQVKWAAGSRLRGVAPAI